VTTQLKSVHDSFHLTLARKQTHCRNSERRASISCPA